jgi:ketosteroid isomerase-like protein
MRTTRPVLLALGLALAFSPPALHADGPADEATKLAVKLTEEGAAVFDTFSARAMADFYAEDAEIAIVTRGDEGLKVQTHKGKAEIEKAYAELFKKPETIKSRNHVEYAKFLAPDILVIAGTFELNSLKPDSPKIPFYQVRMRSGDRWLMSSLKIFFVPPK